MLKNKECASFCLPFLVILSILNNMEAWDKFLILLESDLGAATVLKWLHPLKIIRFDACNLYLEASDSFQINWFEEHIRPKILSSLFNNNKKRIKVHLSLSKRDSEGLKPLEKKKDTPVQSARELTFDALDPHYCFEEYIELESSPLPFKILSSLDAKQTPPFNPIYIYGDSGRGKTHLLVAVTHHLQKQGLRALYARAETFTEHVVAAIRAGEMSSFRQAYRNVDALLVDDVQVFARKSATQEEFFHTFNTLHLAGKQIILAANCAPQELPNIEPRLISRFEWGIVLPLSSPTEEEMVEMLNKKANAMNFPLSQKLITYLLETFTTTKSLIRALQALILRTHLDETTHHFPAATITIPQAKALLNDLTIEEEKNKLTAQKIIQHVCEYYGLLPPDLLGKAQSRDRVLPRQIAMYFCRQELKLPFVKVGELFSKDHSTVMSSVKIVQTALDNGVRDIIDPLEAIRKRFQ